jgi:hypothetical protein
LHLRTRIDQCETAYEMADNACLHKITNRCWENGGIMTTAPISHLSLRGCNIPAALN